MPKFNVNFSDSTYQVLGEMSRRLDQPMAEVIRESLSMYWWLIKEVSNGSALQIERAGNGGVRELVIPYLEHLREPTPSGSTGSSQLDMDPVDASGRAPTGRSGYRG